MYIFLGWFNFAAVIIMTAPYWLRFLNKHIIKTKSSVYTQTIKTLRLIHKPLGILLLIAAAIHGLLALGALRLHTGTVLGTMLFITALLGLTFLLTRKKGVFAWHKRAALILAILLAVHLIFPSAVYMLFSI